MTERMKKAWEFQNMNFNCAQSVLAAFHDVTGLNDETAKRIAGGLGAGFGGSREEACGALSGAILVLGFAAPHVTPACQEEKDRVYAVAKEFRSRFQARFGGTGCGELLGLTHSEADWQWAEELKSRRICIVFVVEAVRMLEEYLKELGVLNA